MGLEQKLSLKLSQRLVMTPTLQQAIKLLQMTRLELSDVVNEEIVANPVLEEEEPEGSSEEEGQAGSASANADGAPSDAGDDARDHAETRAEADEALDGAASLGEMASGEAGEADGSGVAETTPAPGPEAEVPLPSTNDAANDLFEQLNLEEYFGEYLDGTATAPRMSEEGEEFSLENRAATPPGLYEHLTEQLGVSAVSAEIREAVTFLIGNVDPDGYLRMTPEEIAAGVPCAAETAEEAVRVLQSFDPVGVGARGLAECLLIQAKAREIATPLLVELITHRFTELGTKPIPLVARQMGVAVEELQRTIELLRTLDPRPGRRYDSSRTVYVEPDVAVLKVGEELVVAFNDDGLPRLRISSRYRRMLMNGEGGLDGEGKSFLREKMRAAQWLMKSLDQRKRTIVRVAESIVKKQREFFEYGVSQLRPLVLRDVAEDIGMHESTVSRVVSNKWMSTPRGLLPMKFFFHSAIASSGGDDVSSLAVKGKIRTLVEAEDPCHPLSDARLSELLAREGIRIARRTVAKYREELRIPSSSIRRLEPAGEVARGVPPIPEAPEGAGRPNDSSPKEPK